MKRCIVQKCCSIENEARFIYVPKDLRADFIYISTNIEYAEKTPLYICEKHFDVDSECYIKKGKLCLVEGVLPSKNGIIEDRLAEILDVSKFEAPPSAASTIPGPIREGNERRKQDLSKTRSWDESTFPDERLNAHSTPVKPVDKDFESWDVSSFDQRESEAENINENTSSDDVQEEVSFTDFDTSSNDANESDYSYENDNEDFSRKQSCADAERMLESTMQLFEMYPEYYLGIQESNMGLIDILTKHLQIIKRDLFIVFFKIRRNESLLSIAHRFGLSQGRVSQILEKNLEVLAINMKQFVNLPINKRDVKRNLPINFKNRFSNVRHIIDCFETPLEKPSNSVEQALTWSSYYSDNTAEVLVSCTPDGTIDFVSAAYGGRISDEKILLKSGFLNILEPGTTVMADRGFKDCDKYFRAENVNFIRPPSVKAGEKLDKSTAIEAKVIASLRINIERAIGKLRTYKIINKYSLIPAKFRKYFDYFVIIAAALSNLTRPLIRNG